MQWRQPICPTCYSLRYPEREPVRTTLPCPAEKCCDCGNPTLAGIFFRVDPRTVKFPSHDR